MRMDLQGHVFAPYRLKPDRDTAALMLRSMGVQQAPASVPPTYFLFLRGETKGVNLFEALEIPRQKALHGGQRYEWHAPIGWDDEVEVTATVEKLTEKEGKRGKVWFADIRFDYRKPDGTLALTEITRLVKTS